ncbi:GDL motif peptide-associated radical SAM/SPASM maturase [Undibacterium sp. YM2]|uniref:GDL motif peptide-associated radical SAM/SPASM maturase n=1 Tax=Undibacterium sp. YM2 TaxID=2058625 RepID=UPI0013896CC6|nr:GDL motif peptide-associated radical SAM/SPASM maturase [Undibacterium sp. YM2]
MEQTLVSQSSQASQPARARTLSDLNGHTPVHVVWEITLACNLKCSHCGSRAGKRRVGELSTEEAFSVIDQLAALGTREITLIGGEAFLRKDWLQMVERIAGHGIRVGMQTGARNLNTARLEAGKQAGLFGIGVSIDGMKDYHDRLRGVVGSWNDALRAMETAKSLGLGVSCNTQIGAETIDQLEPLFNRIIEAGATHWQLQITVAMGNAVENDHLLLQPHRVLELMPLLNRLYHEGQQRGLLLTFGNNLGYFGPFEHHWRGLGDETLHWTGCAAGQNVIGLEADGTIKGCPSLATETYGGGNVRDTAVAELWNTSEALHFGRMRNIDSLWGHCRTCYYADVCRGGCTWTSDSLFGKPGNNPYCHYRALKLEKRGIHEKIRKVAPAPDKPFAIGRFELYEEAIPGRQILPEEPAPAPRVAERTSSNPLPELGLCRNCHEYIWQDETECPHCHADVAAAAQKYAIEEARRQAVMTELKSVLDRLHVLTSTV